MSWEPPDPNRPAYIPPPPPSSPDAELTVRRPVRFEAPPAATPPAPRRWIPIVVVAVALLAGGGLAFLLTGNDDQAASDTTGAPPTTSDGPAPTTAPGGSDTTTPAPTTDPVPTTVPSPVTRDHLVFHDGYALGRITPAGWVRFGSDGFSQLTPANIEAVLSISDLQVASFPVEVRALSADEATAFCGPTIGPRPANNATPVGLWIDAPSWAAVPPSVVPAPFAELSVATVAVATAAVDISSPPFSPGQAVLADLTGDGVNDLVVAASYWDASVYYQVVAVAMDADATKVQTVFVRGGSPSADGAGNPLPGTALLLRVDAIADVTGDGRAELVVRFQGAGERGATLFDLQGAELGGWRCPP